MEETMAKQMEYNGDVYLHVFPIDYSRLQQMIDDCKGENRNWYHFSLDLEHPGNQSALKDYKAHKHTPMSPELVRDIIAHKDPDSACTFNSMMAANGYVLQKPLDDMCDALQPTRKDKRDLREKRWHKDEPSYWISETTVDEPDIDPDDYDDFCKNLHLLMNDSIDYQSINDAFSNKAFVAMLHRYAFLKKEEQDLYDIVEDEGIASKHSAPLSESYKNILSFCLDQFKAT